MSYRMSVTLLGFVALRWANRSEVHDVGEVEHESLNELDRVERSHSSTSRHIVPEWHLQKIVVLIEIEEIDFSNLLSNLTNI